MEKTYEYHEFPENTLREYLNVNIDSCTFMTRLLLPRILRRFSSEGKKRGIVNISSISETGLRTYQAIYCATRAFITVFSRALAVEYKGRIDFLCTIPRQVNTRMNPGLGIKYISPEVCACSQLRLGY